ncbi:cytidine deaminase 1-like [Trifolium pratense]|uniref:cytidine deaminase 1-like n=1 Tax=Trifolium pratense TaxID=57577 RepID=UPI001E6956D5|nr:cytidine deaminase 1-like [Trifolium pratense]
MAEPRFIIEASEAKSISQSTGLTLTQLLPNIVKSAQPLARVPISKFHVAAVGVGISGRIFIGVNVEFPNLPFHHTIHAEQFLLTNLSQNKETQLQYLAVSAAPCGHCRQFLQEIRGASDIPLLITNSDSSDFTSLSQFLSHPFGPHDLLPKHVPLFLEPRHNDLSLLDLEASIDDSIAESNGYTNQLKVAALEAANESHAPYSESPSGVALLDSSGNVYKGSYMESAAYNPSLGPVQAAIVAFIAGSGAGDGAAEYGELVEAVLVEKEDAVVKQESTARLFLSSISPHCRFNVFLCTSNNNKIKN